MQEASAFFRNYSLKAEQELEEEEETQKNVLCLDPDPEVLQRLDTILSANGFRIVPARTLGEALDLLVRYSPGVCITEVIFPDTDGAKIIQSLRRIDRDLVILILSVQKERRTSKNRRLEHVFEFIEKPGKTHELIGHLKRAFTYHREKQFLKQYLEETRERIKQQLEWLIWTQHNQISNRIHFSKAIVDSIKHSITQGNGVGSLITFAEMIQFSAKPDGDKGDRVSVPSDLITSLMESAGTVRNWLEEMDAVSRNLAKKYETETLKGELVIAIVKDTVESMERYRKIKNQTIRLEEIEFNQPLTSNTIVLKLSLRELLTNALKFSPENSMISVRLHRTSNSLSIIVANRILAMEGGLGGIPMEYEQRIFEPFFRLNNINDDRFHTEMYGMGTGLTIIQNAVNQVGGKIYLYEAVDPETIRDGTETDEEMREKRVMAELIFPIDQASHETES